MDTLFEKIYGLEVHYTNPEDTQIAEALKKGLERMLSDIRSRQNTKTPVISWIPITNGRSLTAILIEREIQIGIFDPHKDRILRDCNLDDLRAVSLSGLTVFADRLKGIQDRTYAPQINKLAKLWGKEIVRELPQKEVFATHPSNLYVQTSRMLANGINYSHANLFVDMQNITSRMPKGLVVNPDMKAGTISVLHSFKDAVFEALIDLKDNKAIPKIDGKEVSVEYLKSKHDKAFSIYRSIENAFHGKDLSRELVRGGIEKAL